MAKKKLTPGTMKKVLRYIGKYKLLLPVSILLALITVAATLYFPVLIGDAIDCIVEAGKVDFVLMHETLHAALQHCTRGHDYDQYIFNVACDIVVNSNILKANGMLIT